jgi:hypothetical protein
MRFIFTSLIAKTRSAAANTADVRCQDLFCRLTRAKSVDDPRAKLKVPPPGFGTVGVAGGNLQGPVIVQFTIH